MSQRTCYEAATPMEMNSALDRSVTARRNTRYDASEMQSGGKACDGVLLPSDLTLRSRILILDDQEAAEG